MAKFTRDGIAYHSDLEYDRYQYFVENDVRFEYHLPVPIALNLYSRKNYSPDFVIIEDTTAIIEETKGYNKWSGNIDNEIMAAMRTLVKNNQELLIKWLAKNDIHEISEVKYRRIKYLKSDGWVDYKFKSKTLKDQWKKKCLECEKELKDINKELKDYKRYISYLFKDKLTKSQREWKDGFEFTITGSVNDD